MGASTLDFGMFHHQLLRLLVVLDPLRILNDIEGSATAGAGIRKLRVKQPRREPSLLLEPSIINHHYILIIT